MEEILPVARIDGELWEVCPVCLNDDAYPQENILQPIYQNNGTAENPHEEIVALACCSCSFIYNY